MPRRTFILGAGFSVEAGFPLVRDLREEVISQIETERHPSWEVHLRPHVHGYPEGQFYAGLHKADPDGSMGFEELLIAMRDQLPSASSVDARHLVRRVLRDACGRLLWKKQRALSEIPMLYKNFASWVQGRKGNGGTNAIISLNWDVLAEQSLSESAILWSYTTQPARVPIIKPHGSINWSDHRARGLTGDVIWQPISPGSPFSYIPSNPLVDPFESGLNQMYRMMVLPGDSEDEDEIAAIWAEAEEVVRERDIVVFIGYSLPFYDSSAVTFFKRVTAGKEVEVYTRSQSTLDHYRAEIENVTTRHPTSFQQSPYAQPSPKIVIQRA